MSPPGSPENGGDEMVDDTTRLLLQNLMAQQQAGFADLRSRVEGIGVVVGNHGEAIMELRVRIVALEKLVELERSELAQLRSEFTTYRATCQACQQSLIPQPPQRRAKIATVAEDGNVHVDVKRLTLVTASLVGAGLVLWETARTVLAMIASIRR